MSREPICMSNVMAIDFLEHIGVPAPTQEQIDIVEQFIDFYSKRSEYVPSGDLLDFEYRLSS